MEAKDLMIDDWVYDTILQGYTRVKVLTARGVKGDIHDNIWGEDTFAPIPLTPEILEKNGFTIDRYEEECIADYTFIKKPIFRYSEDEYYIEYDGWTLVIIIDIPGSEIKIYPDASEKIYVHELQHALRLCGIEKEIEL